jgi:hypothetical protein
MKAILGIIFLAFFMLIACRQKEEVKGVIFERKELPDNRLLIRYHYLFSNKTYFDSATVSNKVLPLDSINVIIDPQVPAKSLPDLTGR